MKKLFTLFIAMTTAVTGFAQLPILVGHRGSSYGVENSVESFTNGAKLGYTYLETDFKVTKDLQFVCSHDDDLTRLGSSSMTIAGNTLADLQAVTFTQTRLGTKYTGRLCSAQEYLDVCKQYNVRPLIELKWATGINSNDCSNIPLLIKLVEDNGFRDKCIILTSMKPCLEYIRKNYPDIKLQFLTGQYWANHFDWCVQWDIDVDIQAGYFDKATVQKYHDAGLKVNMWTTNTTDGYLQYGNWGCDFITTDNLDGHNLPELDPSVLFPPNTVDYPNNTDPVKGSYTSQQVAQLDMPAELAGRKIKKAIIDGDEWIVLSRGDASRIDRVNVLTGKVTSTYALGPLDDIADIALTADGVLVALDGTGSFYTWTSKTAEPTLFHAGGESMKAACLAASGRLKDLKVYLGRTDESAVNIVGLWFQNGSLYKTVNATDPANYTTDKWGDFSITVTPSSRDCILIDSPVMTPVEYRFDWEADNQPMTVYGTFADGLMPVAANGIGFYRRATKVYAVLPDCADDRSALNATIYDATDGIAAAEPVTDALHTDGGLGTAPASYTNTALSMVNGKLHAHIFAAENGMASFLLDADKEPEPVKDVDLELTCDWILSDTNGNAPQHIDGTNAQQGTAVNGRFYINDCNDRQIHIFDQSGYLGAIPGGSGWGCARDDAGNIVVRDDKETGTSHKFIIYPVGAMPDNYGTPVTLDVTVPLAGQTNFINAGGDLLGGTGHIYLFPNKQTGVNIITVRKGVIGSVKAANDLSFAGSTAGYVVPVNDDPENWLYQVRGTGINFYNGGVNNPVSNSRASTTQPARNSTGGMAYFTMSGNNILVHNSGKNYLGGFTVRNLSAGNTDAAQVVKNVEPIGTKGYTTGGNYSTFNWLIPEKVSDGEYTLYQYCPANGIAKYTLRDKLNAVNDILVDNTDDLVWNLTADHNTLTVNGIDVTTLRVYNVAGVLVATAEANTANITNLAPGLYIVTVNNTASRKFLKK